MILLLVVMVVGLWGAEVRRGVLLGRERGQEWEPETLKVVAEAVKSHVGLCHLVVVTPPLHSPRLRQVFKFVRAGAAFGEVVVTVARGAEGERNEDLPSAGDFKNVFGYPSAEGAKLSCRAVVLVALTPADTDLTLSFVEAAAMWRLSDTRVVVVGVQGGAERALLHPSLRNTVHAHYLALPLPQNASGTRAGGGGVAVYGRCLYCGRGGEAAVYLLCRASGDPQVCPLAPPAAPPVDMQGHLLRAVIMAYPPYLLIERDKADPKRYLLQDSPDRRVLYALVQTLNFTYEVMEPEDRQWGILVSDKDWNGMVGILQREEGDFSFGLSPHPSRHKVISFSTAYYQDRLTILSPKPEPLSRHMAIACPFSVGVWLVVAVSTASLGVTMWLLQRACAWLYGERAQGTFSAFCYSCGILLERPPAHIPRHLSGRVLVGWWLLTAMVLTTAYRSSLAADLSVLSFPPPINTFQDILSRPGWTWGSRGFHGSTYMFFNMSIDPVISQISRGMEILDPEAGLRRVLDGRFSFIMHQSEVLVYVKALYEDGDRKGPFHIGTTRYANPAGNAVGTRKGAPFLDAMNKRIQGLFEMGIIDFWIEEGNSILARQRKLKIHNSKSQGSHALSAPPWLAYKNSGRGEVVLGLEHLQGAFYLLFLGHGIALLFLVVERINITLTSAKPVL
ncbi:glutamate receptor ionotropic, delta-2-like isoform X2 [Eriocheir sinensis]|uniref:glutamate receptor ionotropic, delta-2-like isoform X2 n=1 Tax=Eriocheir sinensis TaxID=95602 RepID=UPI0021CA8FED|nr:glutamate receptor ionotropic, delta-2-like isoform X2 [Eriocheir sinensis]